MIDEKEVVKKEEAEEGAPAVVGQLQVSNDLLDFSCFAKKTCKTEKKCDVDSKDCELTPRERAILERKKKEEK